MADVELADAMPQLGVYPVLPTVPLVTSGTPQTYDATPAVLSITTGGTAGDELVDLDLPDLPVDGWANPYLVGQRVVFGLVVQTNAADRVVITAGGSGALRFYPSSTASGIRGVLNGVVLDYVGAMVCFIWCGDSWKIDYAYTGNNFGGENDYTSASMSTVGADNTISMIGGSVEAQTEAGASGNLPGGDYRLILGDGSGAGRQGTLVIAGGAHEAHVGLPDADLGVVGGLYYDPADGNRVKYHPPA
jgi:hypothetical protein